MVLCLMIVILQLFIPMLFINVLINIKSGKSDGIQDIDSGHLLNDTPKLNYNLSSI